MTIQYKCILIQSINWFCNYIKQFETLYVQIEIPDISHIQKLLQQKLHFEIITWIFV